MEQEFDLHDNARADDNGIFDNYYKQSEMITKEVDDVDPHTQNHSLEDDDQGETYYQEENNFDNQH